MLPPVSTTRRALRYGATILENKKQRWEKCDIPAPNSRANAGPWTRPLLFIPVEYSIRKIVETEEVPVAIPWTGAEKHSHSSTLITGQKREDELQIRVLLFLASSQAVR